MTPFDLPTRSYLPAAGDDAAAVVDRLAKALAKRRGAGLEAVTRRAQISTRTVLDTADRRLRAGGLDLGLESGTGGRGRLVLREGAGVPTTVADLGRVRRRYVLGDLPPGPLREHLEPIVDVRALLPIVSIRRRALPVDIRNMDGKTVVRLTVSDLWVLPPSSQPPLRITGRVDLAAILGYPRPFARVDDLLAARLGLEPADRDLADEAVLALGGDPAGLAFDDRVKLAPGDSAESAARHLLLRQAEVVDANLPGTLEDLDTEFLHDLRVAIRRSRSVLRELKGVFPPEAHREQADALRWIQAVTGPTRDLDVQLLEWEDLVARVAEERRGDLEPAHAVLVTRRAAAFRTLRRTLRSAEFRRAWSGWKDFLASDYGDVDGRPDAVRPVKEVAGRRIDRVFRGMVRDGGRIDADSPAQDLHDLRKRGKELRYLLELFGGLWPGRVVKPLVAQLKELQDVLGRHQDREVQGANLRDLAPELSGTEGGARALLGLGALIDRLEQDEREARGEFAERFARFAASQVPS